MYIYICIYPYIHTYIHMHHLRNLLSLGSLSLSLFAREIWESLTGAAVEMAMAEAASKWVGGESKGVGFKV